MSGKWKRRGRIGSMTQGIFHPCSGAGDVPHCHCTAYRRCSGGPRICEQPTAHPTGTQLPDSIGSFPLGRVKCWINRERQDAKAGPVPLRTYPGYPVGPGVAPSHLLGRYPRTFPAVAVVPLLPYDAPLQKVHETSNNVGERRSSLAASFLLSRCSCQLQLASAPASPATPPRR